MTDPTLPIRATERSQLTTPGTDVTLVPAPIEPSSLSTPTPDVTPSPAPTELLTPQVEGSSTADPDSWTAPVFLGVEWNGSAYVALAALVVAIVSAVFTGKNWWISKQQEDRRAARIETDVRRTVAWRDPDGEFMWIGVLASIEHPSDRDGSIAHVDLSIKLADSAPIKIPHSPSRAEGDGKYLDTPRRLLANDSQLGWVTFKIPKEFYSRPCTGRHIEIRDGRGFTFEKPLDHLAEVDSDPTSRTQG